MEDKNAPRKIEAWEFQEILRQLAADSNPVSAIPQLEYPSKETTHNIHRERILCNSNRTLLEALSNNR